MNYHSDNKIIQKKLVFLLVVVSKANKNKQKNVHENIYRDTHYFKNKNSTQNDILPKRKNKYRA